jgi:two-component system cell cycle response regulator DivK
MERAREAGFDGFIAKPLSVRDFPNQIRAILRGEEVWVADSKA